MKRSISCALLCLMPSILVAEELNIPFGTTVFCELDQRLTTKKKVREFVEEGDLVRAHVWKDVRVDGRVAIAAGTPVYARVSRMKKARIAGRKGDIEIEVLNVTAVDDSDVPLDGGYDKSGKGRMGLSIALAAVVAWPLIFIKGKQAWLEPGTVFDGFVRSTVTIEIPDEGAVPVIHLQPALAVTVLYDGLDPKKKIRDLPLSIEIGDEEQAASASIVSVNDGSVEPIPVRNLTQSQSGDYRGSVDFKALSKHFGRGMNRFEVQVGENRAEVLLEIEL